MSGNNVALTISIVFVVLFTAFLIIVGNKFAREAEKIKKENERKRRAAERESQKVKRNATIQKQREELIKKPAEIERLLKLNYNQLVNELLVKYGPARYDYFSKLKGSLNIYSKSHRISRTVEGLFVHHIDENRYPGLSSDRIYNYDFQEMNGLSDYQIRLIRKDFQRAERLVYCDLIEHLLLHVKAFENQRPLVVGEEIASRGAYIIGKDVVRALAGRFGIEPWQTSVAKAIEGQWDEYLSILRYAHNVAKINGFDRLIKNAEKEKEKHENMILRRRSYSCQAL